MSAWQFDVRRGLVYNVLLGLLWLLGAVVVAFAVAIGHDVVFEYRHECVKTGKYREYGHIVGIAGKGGYYQPSGWHYYCREWMPNDGGRTWLN